MRHYARHCLRGIAVDLDSLAAEAGMHIITPWLGPVHGGIYRRGVTYERLVVAWMFGLSRPGGLDQYEVRRRWTDLFRGRRRRRRW